MKNLISSVVILLAFSLIGCGGGSSTTTDKVTPHLKEQKTVPEESTSLNLPAIPQIPADK